MQKPAKLTRIKILSMESIVRLRIKKAYAAELIEDLIRARALAPMSL
jgi:hypothetical protein